VIAGTTIGPSQVLAALDQRLSAAAEQLLPEWLDPEDPTSRPPGLLAASLLPELAAACGRRPSPGPDVWLLLTAVSAAFPVAHEVEEAARLIALEEPDRTAEYLLDHVLREPPAGRLDLPMLVVSDQVVVDVDSCAQNDSQTGIQRVVRETVPRWRQTHPVLAVSSLADRSCYRLLTARQEARIYDFGRHYAVPEGELADPMLVVPWQTAVVWPEVPHPDACLRLAAMARYSGNTVGIVGYDMIPIVTAELRPFGEAGIFQRYLGAVKHADRVAGISISATTEFRGFVEMISAQGMPTPVVEEIMLAEDVGDHSSARVGGRSRGRPVIMLPGRPEPHKNLRASLQAAERLWLEGYQFEVVMFEGQGNDASGVRATIARLRAQGRPITTLGYITDDDMWAWFRQATFVVFASLHEGYGLPIAEALACGTPVITANFGSQREIAERGGCIMVDPRNDTQLTDAIRLLLADPDRLAALRAEIPRRPHRSWDEYATSLWSFLVEGHAA
jgi:glycosyltransferase involved in cell wall biosynthesis